MTWLFLLVFAQSRANIAVMCFLPTLFFMKNMVTSVNRPEVPLLEGFVSFWFYEVPHRQNLAAGVGLVAGSLIFCFLWSYFCWVCFLLCCVVLFAMLLVGVLHRLRIGKQNYKGKPHECKH
jgi:hypothetical protein